MNKEEIQEVITQYENLKKDEIYPNCAICSIRWKDDNHEDFNYIFSFIDVTGTALDDEVFYICDGFYDFINLLEDENGEDFEIVSVDILGCL